MSRSMSCDSGKANFRKFGPLKRGGGRRYYRPEDVDLLRRIRSLLYEEGYTIKGAQKLLKGQRRPPTGRKAGANNRSAADHASDGDQHEAETALQPDGNVEKLVLEPALRETLAGMRDELAELRELLKTFTG